MGFGKKLMPKLEDWIVRMHDEQGHQLAELTFITDACATVIEARSTLKWTYPLAYYLDEEFPPDIKNFFVDFWQKDLE